MLKEKVELNYGNGKIYIPELDDMEILITDEDNNTDGEDHE